MLKHIKKIVAQSPLLQVTSFNSFSIVVKLITSFAVSKLIALFLGPSGLTYIGNLRNALSVLQNFITGGLVKAAVRYSGENKHDEFGFKTFISTLLWVLIFLSLVVFILVYGFSESLSNLVFDQPSYSFVFKWLSVLLPIYGMNAFMLSVLNGLNHFKKVIKINLFTHILNLLLFGYCLYFYGLNGALMAIIILPSASLVLTCIIARKHLKVFKIDLKLWTTLQVKNFGQYAFMTMISAISFPLVYLGIRQYLTAQINIDAAGYWEANFRLSTFYLIFMQSLLNLYILPKYVQAKSLKEFRGIAMGFYKQILPLFAFGLIILFLLRKYLVLIVFSEEFMPVTSILGWQMIGDFFRISALVLVYQFHAKKMVWHYVLTDLFLAIGLYFSAILGVQYFDITGVVIGHAFTYVVYFLIILFIFRKSILNIKVNFQSTNDN
ncbi:O-antigen translocase [Mesohalobacter halotolerans]|uniref:O-antigen translocase n=1 Tax=Mesohalobacter halotolerans TaxID=1883405 RepID=A0A4U5TPI4_9FLAO|nr:O-antigen translocase [Mesohalobacter halotolerans]MBS3739190.1 O-antigen translocase [Psychroflexus sp.]TKS56019.1 O-antigen translocase [Mesohalobacter halotolerans]